MRAHSFIMAWAPMTWTWLWASAVAAADWASLIRASNISFRPGSPCSGFESSAPSGSQPPMKPRSLKLPLSPRIPCTNMESVAVSLLMPSFNRKISACICASWSRPSCAFASASASSVSSGSSFRLELSFWCSGTFSSKYAFVGEIVLFLTRVTKQSRWGVWWSTATFVVSRRRLPSSMWCSMKSRPMSSAARLQRKPPTMSMRTMHTYVDTNAKAAIVTKPTAWTQRSLQASWPPPKTRPRS
mmetsp:Transcript_28544/g.94721  ORF Transcript_28544/g.94721 Transcript_28544/m.94721 type:complete len:243 (-) Transcript_28544:1324-2052(-)